MASQLTAQHSRTIRARRACVLALAVVAGLGYASGATDTYVSTMIDSSGQLHITTKRKREIVPKMESDQAGFSDVKISPDMKAVGWLALFPNCCTSYPIAMKLLVLSNDQQHTFEGTGLPISRWCFWAEGKQVAFEQETVHGGMGVHYELRNIEAGDLADKYDPDANPTGVTKPPKWVVILDSNGY